MRVVCARLSDPETGALITDEELAGLPEDPELAFVEFERIARARLYGEEQRAVFEEYSVNSIRLEYINKVLAAARAFGIAASAEWEVPTVRDNIRDAYDQFTADVDHFTIQIRIRHAPRNRRNSIGLDRNSKTIIHHHIAKIRDVIERSDIPDAKKESLYGKLNRLAEDVDKDRTNLEAGMAIYIEICNGIGRGFKALEPARQFVDSIAGLLGRAKEDEENSRPALQRSSEIRRLEAPRPKLASPSKSNGADRDDEVPF